MYTKKEIRLTIESVERTSDLVKAQKNALEVLAKIAFNIMVSLEQINTKLEEKDGED